MAYIPIQNPYDLQNQQQPDQSTAQPLSQDVATSAQPQAQGQAPAQKVVKGGSSFPDVSRYLSQNKDQAKRLASQVGGNVLNSANANLQRFNQARNQFNQQVGTNTVNYNTGLGQQFRADPRSFFQQSAPTGGKKGKKNSGALITRDPNAPPEGVATPAASPFTPANQADLNAFLAMRNASYAGPNSLSEIPGYSDALTGLQTTQRQTDLLDNPSGRNDLLKPFYDNSTGAGASTLDNLLLGSNAGQNVLGGVSNEIGRLGLGDLIGNANQQSIEQANAARTTTQETASKIQDLAQGVLGDLRLGQQKIKGQKTEKMSPDQANAILAALNEIMGTNYNLEGVLNS